LHPFSQLKHKEAGIKKLLFFVCIVSVMAFTGVAMADSKPIQLSLTPDAHP
jgi:hypothetical protein